MPLLDCVVRGWRLQPIVCHSRFEVQNSLTAMLAGSVIALTSCLAATLCARAGVDRLQPALARSSCRCSIASFAGGGFSLLFAVLALKSDTSPCLEPSAAAAVMMICPFLSVAAYTDIESSWAPSELMVPICIYAAVIFLPPRHVAELAAWSAPVFVGIALLWSARLAWRLQCALRRPAIPPADCIALALPVGLFGMHGVSASAFAFMALALLAIRAFPAGLSPFRGRTACDGFSSGAKFIRMPERVPFLSISFPIILLGLLASAAFGFPPADACG